MVAIRCMVCMRYKDDTTEVDVGPTADYPIRHELRLRFCKSCLTNPLFDKWLALYRENLCRYSTR